MVENVDDVDSLERWECVECHRENLFWLCWVEINPQPYKPFSKGLYLKRSQCCYAPMIPLGKR